MTTQDAVPGAVAARIRGIGVHLPETVLDDATLAMLCPGRSPERI